MLALAFVLAAAPAAFPQALTHPLVATAERWKWPAPAVFQRAFEARKGRAAAVNGLLVVKGAIDGTSGYFVVSEESGALKLYPLAVGSSRTWRYRSWSLKSTDGSDWEATASTSSSPVTFHVTERLDPTMSDADLIPWTYTTTLLAASGDLYADGAGDAPDLDKLVFSLREKGAAEAWAAKNKGDAALYERFRRFRPIGGCSMDTRPQEAARVYAELAYARGDLGRFLQLQVRIMGDQFDRVATSSYGEAAHGTEAERLLSTGIDVDQFLLGLLIARPGRREGLDTWRLARSIREAGRQASMEPLLRATAESASTDPLNRLRAAQVWVYLKAGADSLASRDTYDKPLAEAATLDLNPVARAWVEEALAPAPKETSGR